MNLVHNGPSISSILGPVPLSYQCTRVLCFRVPPSAAEGITSYRIRSYSSWVRKNSFGGS